MNSSYRQKLVTGVMTVALLFSTLAVFNGAQASPSDLSIDAIFEEEGNPPPRANKAYNLTVTWTNNDGSQDYNAKIRLYLNEVGDCDSTTSAPATESDSINMAAGTTDSIILSIVFLDTGANCVLATIYYDETNYGGEQYETLVEPEIGVADLWISFDNQEMQNGTQPGAEINIAYFFGNDGNVSTPASITIMTYLDPLDSLDPANAIYDETGKPVYFDFLPPSEGEESAWYLWSYEVPGETEEGEYKITIVIDADENNTDDSILDNNSAEWPICIGDCTVPDLVVHDMGGPSSISPDPPEAVAGDIVTFSYSIENIGDGMAKRDNGFVMHLEVMKCLGTGEDPCLNQSDWVKVNHTTRTMPPIISGGVFTSMDLNLNWSTTSENAGLWNVRIFVDANNVFEESNEDNNYLDYYKVNNSYFRVVDQRPDLIVAAIDEGTGKVYEGDPRLINVAITQTEDGDKFAENVDVWIKITDPIGGSLPGADSAGWLKFTEDFDAQDKIVGVSPEIKNFGFTWNPVMHGEYQIDAWVDKDNAILEWDYEGDPDDDNNNEYPSHRKIWVVEKLPDLKITSMFVNPLNVDGNGMVGVPSNLTATIINDGVENLSSTDGQKLEVIFYITNPKQENLGVVNVDQYCSINTCSNWMNYADNNVALAIGDRVNITIPIVMEENLQYRFLAKVDCVDQDEDYSCDTSNGRIKESEEANNEKYISLYAISSIDAFVADLSIESGDGLAGKDHPISFDLGMANLPDDRDYKVFFNVTIEGQFTLGTGGSYLRLFDLTSGSPIGSGYEKCGNFACIVFNNSYKIQRVSIPWIPDASKQDNYKITITVESAINTDLSNDAANTTISIEKLTTNLLIDAIKVTESDGSATIRVTVSYQTGDVAELGNVSVKMLVYRASDYPAGTPIGDLTTKTIENIGIGDPRQISFTWAIKNGDYIFVAIVDPDDNIRERDESDNSYPSKLTTFGDKVVDNQSDEEDEGLLPALSFVVVFVLISLTAFLRRRT